MDKVIKDSKGNILKIGDRVKSLDDGDEGREGILNKYEDGSVPYCLTIDGDEHCWMIKVEKIETEKIETEKIETEKIETEKIEGKFKIGDMVEFNGGGGSYSLTTKDAGTMEIVGIDSKRDENIEVQILTHKTSPEHIGTSHWVNSDYFKLVKPGESKSPLTSNIMDTEVLKTFNKENLVEGKRIAEEENASYEAHEAKKAYKKLIDEKEEQDRIIKVANKELKRINEDLKVFGSK